MRKFLALGLVIVLLTLSISPLAYAADEVAVLVNNKKIAFPDQQPYIDKNNRTLVPVRFVSEALGAAVDWDDATQKVTITQGEKKIVLTIGEKTALVNGMAKTFDTQAVLNNKRTMVPLRFVSECLGAKVEWIAKTRTVKITVNNGYTIPEDCKAKVEVGASDDPAKVEISISIDTYYDLEPQFIDAQKVLASKFGNSKANEIVDHARLKTERNAEVPLKYWTLGNQLIRVYSPGGYYTVRIVIWQPGVKI